MLLLEVYQRNIHMYVGKKKRMVVHNTYKFDMNISVDKGMLKIGASPYTTYQHRDETHDFFTPWCKTL